MQALFRTPCSTCTRACTPTCARTYTCARVHTQALFRYALPDLHTDVSTGAVDDDAKLDKLYQVQGYFMTPAVKAAQTQLALASDPKLDRSAVAGKYFVDGKPASPSALAEDAEVAARLWALSEQQAGIKFDPRS